MNLTDYCWSTVQSITQKRPVEIKALLDGETAYPKLESDSSGFVLRLCLPRRASDGELFTLHGESFRNDLDGRLDLWRNFRAALYHLSVHSVVTYFSISGEPSWRSGDSQADCMFAASLVEDYAVRAFMRALWPGLLRDVGYSNYRSYLRFKPLDRGGESSGAFDLEGATQSPLADKISANLLGLTAVGRPVCSINEEIERSIEDLHLDLIELENDLTTFFSQMPIRSAASGDQLLWTRLDFNQKKLNLFRRIVGLFERNATHLRSVHSLPYTESYGKNVLFGPSPAEIGTEKLLALQIDAGTELGFDLPYKLALNEAADLAETDALLGGWEYSGEFREMLTKQYRKLDPATHFESIVFPAEDYAEFVRTQSRLAGTISAMLEQLNVVNLTLAEAPEKESGELDVDRATQAIASGRQVNEVFLREELLTRNEAWAILIDSSKSLEVKKKQVRDLGVCLAEVAGTMIRNYSSWACYAFDQNFYVLKDFSELYDKTVKGRIGALPNGIRTLLPDAVRLATQRLLRGSEDVKVLLVASDGYPLGYEGIDSDLIRAVEYASKAGIILIGLGVGSPAISKYFRLNLVVENPSDLMRYFVQAYVQLPRLVL